MVGEPAATAATALNTAPSWAGVSPPPENQLSFRRKASWTSVTPQGDMPGDAFIIPGYVDRPSMSSRDNPASSIARSAASTVNERPVRPSFRPTTERPIPEMTASRSPIR